MGFAKRTLVLSFIVLCLSVIPLASAACPVVVAAQNTKALMSEITTLNTDLQSCPTNIPSPMNRLVGNGNVLFNINMNDGTTTTLFITTSNNQATGIALGTGTAKWTATISEPNLDIVLASSSRGTALTQQWLNGNLVIRANTVVTRVGWFFVKPFVKSAAKKVVAASSVTPAAPSGKPANCDDTVPSYHEGYTYAKGLWDQYDTDTDAACQMRQGFMPDATLCVHSVQQSKGGIPYYLCWYNN